jgi:16S rRNA processing protein RimM
LSDPSKTNQRWVQVAHILRPRGNKGEVLAELLTDFSSRFSSMKTLYLGKSGNEPQARGLQNFWVDRNHPNHGIFHFDGSANISDAEKFRDYDIFLPWELRAELPAGKYFVTDLIGCTVFEIGDDNVQLSSPACDAARAPQVLGTVTDVSFTGDAVGGTPLLEVATPQGQLLVPLAEDICLRIDVLARRIEVKLPEGLKDLNAQE